MIELALHFINAVVVLFILYIFYRLAALTFILIALYIAWLRMTDGAWQKKGKAEK
jgi:hypothetical protein